MGTLPTPPDYAERVYAGVLGKMIGVYLGRPVEGWSHERILAELGPIQYYVHDRLGVPLIVTDDDLSGTFTFVRALPDHGNSRAITPAEIGRPGSITSSRAGPLCGGAAWATPPSTPPFCASSTASHLRRAARSPSTPR